jgi:CelD/BcsL family acetyltransferase involved in cellulose biosynthesis
MRVTVIAGKELSGELKERWSEIQLADPDLASPYFCPTFFAAVADVRKDVYCCVLEEGRRVVGFFPFQRRALGRGQPVGGPLSDYQGVIVEKNAEWDARELVRKSGMTLWTFDHLIVSQSQLRQFHSKVDESFLIDLSAGYEAYTRERRRSGCMQISKIEKKQRKLEREAGPVRCELQSNDGNVLRQVMEWKSQQCIGAQGVNIFGFRWTVGLLERIHATREDAFGGRLSALYAGDRLVAAHMGMRSRSVWHWWFPSYNREFARYSPGLILLLKAAEAAEGTGLRIIDLGKGKDGYKRHFTNRCIRIAEGMVALSSVPLLVREFRRRAEGWIKKSPLYFAARVPGRIFRRAEKWYGFQ